MSTTNMIAEPASVHGSPHTIGKAEAAAQTVRSRIIAAPSLDALYRAALTFCIDGADAMMYATLKGAEHAEALWQVLSQCHPDRPSDVRQKALTCIDRMFINGLTRWGRKPTPSAMNAFRNALSGWHQRMDALPSQDIVSLANWFTMDGTQWIIGPGHPCWPAQLTDLSIRSDWAPPLCLWVKGDPRALTSCAKPVGIVGSRDVNEYGRYVAHTVAEQAAVDGHLVVSGGAMGTDAAAHWGALNALHGRKPGCVGRTVAVFAGGLNHMGPARNRTLFERIESQGGALISELCPGTIPEARRFLLRNRIIAALSSTLVVAQARLRSGALNTAGWACELMREVYAVPGDINQPCNAGCNKMIGDHQATILCAATSTKDICHKRHQPIMERCPGMADNAQRDASDPAPSCTTKAVHKKSEQPTLSQAVITTPLPSRTDSKDFSSSHHMPDLRAQASLQPDAEAQQTIQVSTLSEAERLMVGLIRECRTHRLAITPDTLLRAARNNDLEGIPDIATVLELLGALELRGAIHRKTGTVTLSCRLI